MIRMKKEITALLLASALALSTTACNVVQENGDHNTTSTLHEISSTEPTEPTSPKEMLTHDQAFAISREYWKQIIDVEPKSYVMGLSLDEEKGVYIIELINRDVSVYEEAPIIDTIWIDCITGEVRVPDETIEEMITEEQAVDLARDFWSRFWENSDSEKYIIVPVENNRWDQSVHVIMLKHLVYLNGEPSHYSTVEEIWVDRVTGEIRYPSSNPVPDSPEYNYYVPPITEAGDFASYEGIIQLYRNAIHDFARPNYGEEKESALAQNLGITDPTEKEWLRAISASGFLFYDGRGEGGAPHHKLTCGYAIKDLNGDGIDELVLLNDDYKISVIFSMVDGKPILLDSYIPRGSCWIDGDGLLHVNGSGGADVSSNTVYRIAEGGGSLEMIIEYGLNGHEWIGDVAVTKYYKLVNGEKVAITEEEYEELDKQYGTYQGLYEGASSTKECSGLQFTPVFTEAEIAQQTYDAVLCNQMKVYDKLRGRYEYLQNCTTPYMQTPLYAIKDSLRYAYQDLDGDGIDELIIDCGDTIILRYYKGVVYLYDFTFRNAYDLNTDGTYSWNHTGQNFEYGMSQITFEGSKLVSKTLYRVVENTEFYIGEESVNENTLQDYINANPKTQVVFKPLTIASEWDSSNQPSYGK